MNLNLKPKKLSFLCVILYEVLRFISTRKVTSRKELVTKITDSVQANSECLLNLHEIVEQIDKPINKSTQNQTSK